MIETKQQYERITTQMLKRGLPGSAEAMHETIEALREVARAGRNEKVAEHAWNSHRYNPDLVAEATRERNSARVRFSLALDALPDWLTDG